VSDHALDVRGCNLLVEREPEVRQLQRDVRAQLLAREPVEDLLVLGDHLRRLLGVADVLAQERRVHVQPGLVQAAQDDDALVERLARDEACRAEPHPVPVDDSS
jgi:hypothetical protein